LVGHQFEQTAQTKKIIARKRALLLSALLLSALLFKNFYLINMLVQITQVATKSIGKRVKVSQLLLAWTPVQAPMDGFTAS